MKTTNEITKRPGTKNDAYGYGGSTPTAVWSWEIQGVSVLAAYFENYCNEGPALQAEVFVDAMDGMDEQLIFDFAMEKADEARADRAVKVFINELAVCLAGNTGASLANHIPAAFQPLMGWKQL